MSDRLIDLGRSGPPGPDPEPPTSAGLGCLLFLAACVVSSVVEWLLFHSKW